VGGVSLYGDFGGVSFINFGRSWCGVGTTKGEKKVKGQGGAPIGLQRGISEEIAKKNWKRAVRELFITEIKRSILRRRLIIPRKRGMQCLLIN